MGVGRTGHLVAENKMESSPESPERVGLKEITLSHLQTIKKDKIEKYFEQANHKSAWRQGWNMGSHSALVKGPAAMAGPGHPRTEKQAPAHPREPERLQVTKINREGGSRFIKLPGIKRCDNDQVLSFTGKEPHYLR